ncbi:MAG: hypothetical protein ACOX2F_05660 [bacterium]
MFKIMLAVVATMLVLSCSSVEKAGGSSQDGSDLSLAKYELTAKGGKLEFDPKLYVIRKYDANKDKKPDIVNVFKKIPVEGKQGEFDLKIHVKMMDLNHDAKIDVWRFFDENGAVIKEELDFDFDGKVDAVDHYTGGVVRLREICSKFDEKTDVWKHFDEKGALSLIEVDQSGDGKPDYWEHYKNGAIERVEKDTDGDGKPDIFKRSGDSDFTQIIDTADKFQEKTDEVEKVEEVKEVEKIEKVEEVEEVEEAEEVEEVEESEPSENLEEQGQEG